MSRGYRRRILFINRELQGKLIFQVFLASICGVALFTLFFGLLTADNLTVSMGADGVRVGNTPMILAQKLMQAHWLFILVGGAVVSLLTLFVSHRFAGPLYRFEKSFTELADRNLNQHIHLRTKDAGNPLAERVNQFADLYSADIRQLRYLNKELGELSSYENESLSGQALQRMAELSVEMEHILNSYSCRLEK